MDLGAHELYNVTIARMASTTRKRARSFFLSQMRSARDSRKDRKFQEKIRNRYLCVLCKLRARPAGIEDRC